MDRLTERKDDIIYFKKDGDLLAPANMSGFDIRQAMQRLADLEDAEEQRKKACDKCIKQDYCKRVVLP